MRKHIFTFTGGHKLTLNDFKSLDDKMNEIATALASHAYLAILSGIELTVNVGTNTWHHTAGYIVVLGELFYVPAADTDLASSTPINTSGALWFSQVETVVSPSPVTYKNTVSRNVHFTRTATLNTTAGVAAVAYNSFKRYEQIIAEKIVALNELQNATYLNSTSGNLKYKKDGLGFAVLEGKIILPDSAINPGTAIAVVAKPAAGLFRVLNYTIQSNADVSSNPLLISISPVDGKVYLPHGISYDGSEIDRWIHLDGIVYRVAI